MRTHKLTFSFYLPQFTNTEGGHTFTTRTTHDSVGNLTQIDYQTARQNAQEKLVAQLTAQLEAAKVLPDIPGFGTTADFSMVNVPADKGAIEPTKENP